MRVTAVETPGSWTRSWRRWVRPVVGAAILGVLLAQLGAGAVVEGLLSVDALAVAVAVVLTAVTTTSSAWRWQVVAGHLGVGLPLRTAVAACYRSQLVNLTLPGGVVGDVERAVRHGRSAADLPAGLGAVAVERLVGQAVLVPLAVVAAVAAGIVPVPVAGGVLALVVGGLWRVRRHDWSVIARVVLASVVAVAGHVAIFVLVARAVGVDLPLRVLLPLTLVVLLVAGIPLSIAGWGPREGAAAWAFAAAGATAAQGLSVAVAFGAVVTVATLPGAVVLLHGPRVVRGGRVLAPAPGVGARG